MHFDTYAYASNFRQFYSDVDFSLRSLLICSVGVVFSIVAAAVSFRLVYLKRKETENRTVTGRRAVVPPPGSDNAVIRNYYDFEYSMELQIEEVLPASLSQVSHGSSSSQAKPSSGSKLVLTADSVQKQLTAYCEICLDGKESCQMFINDSCSHSFCYDCTSKHVVSRIQDNLKTINCPGADCRATLDFNACGLIIPKDMLAKWDELLCKSIIPDSEKLFCPFRDCSAMLINDSNEKITRISCPECRRSFCVLCLVPWHSDFTCEEFQKLNLQKGAKELVLTRDSIQKPLNAYCEICLDNKECWQMFINDSCKHSFCYDCTSKHVVSRVQDDMETINCPGKNCKATLDFNACRLIIPKDMLAKWDELLCQSIIPDSEKLFCPFRDCSAMLINDSNGKITRISCPECHRSFCVLCHVPWHSDFTCEEFQKLNSQKGAKELVLTRDSIQKPLTAYCEICVDSKESWQMFINDSCSHSFCYECTSKHVVSRVQDNMRTINCPGANCRATLDFNACRLIIPKDMFDRWDELLCQSIIPDSEKLFCPFRDCSAMLINDSSEKITHISCPECHRSFCVMCLEPWHSDFTCEEFQKLNSQKGAKDELMLQFLAKKKHWQKCPSCKIHVEKSDGCIHMTCRCGYEFCYKCGSKWTGSHVCKKSTIERLFSLKRR